MFHIQKFDTKISPYFYTFYFENTPQFYSRLDIQVVVSTVAGFWDPPLDGFQEVLKRLWFFFIWGKMDSSFRTFKNPHVQLWRRLKPFQSCWIWTVIFFCIYSPQLPGRLFSPSDISKKLSHHFLLHFPIGMGSYDHHARYQGVFP